VVGRPILKKVTLELFNENELVDETLDLAEEVERLEPSLIRIGSWLMRENILQLFYNTQQHYH
jgi:hypothetical protein